MAEVVMARAETGEAEMVMELVNTAYRLEVGSEGVAFKTGDRSICKLLVHWRLY